MAFKFYECPSLLRRQTGKQVNVDMVSKPAGQIQTKGHR
jgi:hypothetical protein